MRGVNQGTKSEPSDMSVSFCEGNNTVGAENTQLQSKRQRPLGRVVSSPVDIM